MSRIVTLSVATLFTATALQAQSDNTVAGGTCAVDAHASIACTTTTALSGNVPTLVSLANSQSSITLPNASLANMGLGFQTATGGSTITIKSNYAYTLSADINSGSKAKADFQIGKGTDAGSADYTSFGTSALALVTGQTVTAERTLNTFFKVKYEWITDAPGAVAATVTYTVTAP